MQVEKPKRTHKKWTKEEDDFLIENYISKGLKYCKEKLPHRHSGLISLRAINLNILKAKNENFKIWTIEEDDIIKKHYSEKGGRYCAKYIANVNMSQIKRRAKKLGLYIDPETLKKITKTTRKEIQNNRPNSDFNINLDQFLDIKTKEISYFLGLLWADGHVSSSTHKSGSFKGISLEIVSEDFSEIKPVLDLIGKWGVYTRKRKKSWKETTSALTNNQRLSEFLIEHDYDKKSNSSADKILSKIPIELKHYFFRGLSDGDGSFHYSDKKYKKLKQFGISSTYSQDWSYLEKECIKLGIRYYISQTITKKGFKSSCLRLNGNNTKLFGDYIYKDMDKYKIGLTRKYEKYLLIKKSVENGRIVENIKTPELIESQKKMAIKLHNEGMLCNDILKNTGISSSTFYRIMKNSSIEINSIKSMRIKNKKQALELYNNGMNKEEISKELNLKLRTIDRYLK